jgi:hypothetical protein
MADIVVSFPLIGSAIPSLSGTEEEFRERVMKAPPHWLYHLRIQTAGAFSSRFRPVTTQHLRQLADRLGLSGGFSVEPVEFPFGQLPLWEARVSPCTFALQPDFADGSARLALAVGLAAAATGRAVPATMLFSGCLADSFPIGLPLTRTDDIESKVRLLLGRDPGFRLEPLLSRLYSYPYTREHLGPYSSRARPGEVNLLVIPTRVDRSPRAWGAGLAVTGVEAGLEQFGQADPGELLAVVDRLREGGLLVVQAPTVFHVLRLLGYHHHSPILAERTRDLAGPIEVFRARHEAGAPGPAGLEGEREHEQRMVARLLAAAHDTYSQLRRILDRCQEHVSADVGHVGVVRDPLWLEVLARFDGRGLTDHFLPALPGPCGRALRTGARQVVLNTRDDPDYQQACAADGPWARIYGEERWRRHLEFLGRVRACMELPLRHKGVVLGVLCLGWETTQLDPPRALPFLETLADCAAEVVANHQEQAHQAVEVGGVHDLARRRALTPADLDFLDRLACWAGPVPGRVGVQEQQERQAVERVASVFECYTAWAEAVEQPERLLALSDALVALLRGGPSWLWTLGASEDVFVRLRPAAGEEPPLEVSRDAIRAVVANVAIVEENDPKAPSRLWFLDGVPEAAPPRVAVPLYARRGQLRALLVVKVAALDAATGRLLRELTRLSQPGSGAPVS